MIPYIGSAGPQGSPPEIQFPSYSPPHSVSYISYRRAITMGIAGLLVVIIYKAIK